MKAVPKKLSCAAAEGAAAARGFSFFGLMVASCFSVTLVAIGYILCAAPGLRLRTWRTSQSGAGVSVRALLNECPHHRGSKRILGRGFREVQAGRGA